jgi:hypothetical protein
MPKLFEQMQNESQLLHNKQLPIILKIGGQAHEILLSIDLLLVKTY